MAVDVLGTMPGKKIIVTPGMTELGEKQYEANKEFGTYMAKICDEVILVGKNQTKPIQDGLDEANYNHKHLHIVNDVKQAFTLMSKLKEGDTYVLLENDLPDIFNE
jgi:UDP-N-acetylmuramoyl-tripeptide--D-alanyl-D-alanine ligase